jgi:hypothetical protein
MQLKLLCLFVAFPLLINGFCEVAEDLVIAIEGEDKHFVVTSVIATKVGSLCVAKVTYSGKVYIAKWMKNTDQGATNPGFAKEISIYDRISTNDLCASLRAETIPLGVISTKRSFPYNGGVFILMDFTSKTADLEKVLLALGGDEDAATSVAAITGVRPSFALMQTTLALGSVPTMAVVIDEVIRHLFLINYDFAACGLSHNDEKSDNFLVALSGAGVFGFDFDMSAVTGTHLAIFIADSNTVRVVNTVTAPTAGSRAAALIRCLTIARATSTTSLRRLQSSADDKEAIGKYIVSPAFREFLEASKGHMGEAPIESEGVIYTKCRAPGFLLETDEGVAPKNTLQPLRKFLKKH